MRWGWLARVSGKYLVVLGVIVGSTIWYYVQKVTRHVEPAAHLEGSAPNPAEALKLAKKVERIKVAPFHMLLVDDDLYDIDTGELMFRGWLNGTVPTHLYWEKEKETVLAQYEKGFVRYTPDGKQVGVLARQHPSALSNNNQWVLYSQDKDVWRADVDWDALKLVNEKKITSIQSFDDANFTPNIMLGTDKILVVRVMNQLLRVNLESGEVHPVRIPLNGIAKRRSLDSKYVVGFESGQFYCYDVDADTTKTIQLGRGVMNDFQWLDGNRCLAIAMNKAVVLYDRGRNSLNELAHLPFACTRIGEPSPDGNFVFCEGLKGRILVDVKGRTAQPITEGLGTSWISNDTYAFSRDVPDSSLRGTWLQQIGARERRIFREPFVIINSAPLLISLVNIAIFGSNGKIIKVSLDNLEAGEIARKVGPIGRILLVAKTTINQHLQK